MLLGSVQMCGERISSVEMSDICESLNGHSIRLLSLRECFTTDRDFKKLMKSVGNCKSILQINLNLGLVNTMTRVESLCKALERNRSLTTLLVHGSPLGDEGASRLVESLSTHPNIISLDVGDCQIGDEGLQYICDLLPPDGAKPGLEELTLSVNPSITAKGWAHFSIAMGVSNTLRSLYLDYNGIGDYGAGCLAVAIAASSKMETLDLEGTGITEHGAKVLLHLVANYPVSLKHVVLTGNRVHPNTVSAINTCLGDEEEKGNTSDSGSVTSTTSKSTKGSTSSKSSKSTKKSSSSKTSRNSSRRSSDATLKGSDTEKVSDTESHRSESSKKSSKSIKSEHSQKSVGSRPSELISDQMERVVVSEPEMLNGKEGNQVSVDRTEIESASIKTLISENSCTDNAVDGVDGGQIGTQPQYPRNDVIKSRVDARTVLVASGTNEYSYGDTNAQLSAFQRQIEAADID